MGPGTDDQGDALGGAIMNNKTMTSRLPPWSLGAKLSAALVLVVLLTAFVVSWSLGWLAKQTYFDQMERELDRRLHWMLAIAPAKTNGPLARWRAVAEHIDGLTKVGVGPTLVTVFAVDGQGSLLYPVMGLAREPEPQVLSSLPRQGDGVIRLTLDGEPAWLAYRQQGPGLSVGMLGRSHELLEPTLSRLRWLTLLVTLAMVALVAGLATWLARWGLGHPLSRLVQEAERVAAGDLTPPATLQGRRDELGRLSQALASMALTTQGMVVAAQASEARFRELFSENRDAIFIIGADGRLEDLNPAGLAIFGFKDLERMSAMPDTTSLFADQAQRQAYLSTLRRNGYVQDFPITLRRSDGQAFEALVTATQRAHGQSRFGLVRDVTQMLEARRALQESRDRYLRLLDNAPDIIYRWDITQGSFDYVSQAVVAITGRSPAEALAWPVLLADCLPLQDRQEAARLWSERLAGEGPAVQQRELEIRDRQGRTLWLRERSLLIRGEDGQPLALEGIVTDISQRVLARQAQERARQVVEAILQGLPVPVMVVDQEHRVAHWNRAMEKVTRVPAEQVVGTAEHWRAFYPDQRPIMADLILNDDREGLEKFYSHLSLKRSNYIQDGWECESFFPHLAGRPRHIYTLAAPIRDGQGAVVMAVETLVDLSEKRHLEDELRRLSVTDELTGLYNQRFFYATLQRELDTARRHDLPLCVIMADLDEFKAFNDRYGHLEGDRVLALCGRALVNLVRSSDLPCRYGGEEFVALLPRTTMEEACQVADRICSGIAGLRLIPAGASPDQVIHPVTASVGVALWEADLTGPELVRRADMAMYRAKEEGKNRVYVCLPGEGVKPR